MSSSSHANQKVRNNPRFLALRFSKCSVYTHIATWYITSVLVRGWAKINRAPPRFPCSGGPNTCRRITFPLPGLYSFAIPRPFIQLVSLDFGGKSSWVCWCVVLAAFRPTKGTIGMDQIKWAFKIEPNGTSMKDKIFPQGTAVYCVTYKIRRNRMMFEPTCQSEGRRSVLYAFTKYTSRPFKGWSGRLVPPSSLT